MQENSEWVTSYQLPVLGNILQVVSTRVLGTRGNYDDECTEITVEPGLYDFLCKGTLENNILNIESVKIQPINILPQKGNLLNIIGSELGGISIVDITKLEEHSSEYEDEFMDWLNSILFELDDYGQISVLKWDKADICIIKIDIENSSIYELVYENRVVGFHIDF